MQGKRLHCWAQQQRHRSGVQVVPYAMSVSEDIQQVGIKTAPFFSYVLRFEETLLEVLEGCIHLGSVAPGRGSNLLAPVLADSRESSDSNPAELARDLREWI